NKPGKVSSNVPTEIMSKDQNPMGMPIKRHYSPDEQVSSSVFKAAEDNKLTPPDADN
ncbi:MAG: glutamate:gamma-aminobutyrate antiporter, partial [Lactobacillus johnsonii]|nr:glutamate:gamma-aminobutyrate antiporter [Lactobacillus johnsonii]